MNNPAERFTGLADLTVDWDGSEVVRPLSEGNSYELYERMEDTILRVNGGGRVVIEYPDATNYLDAFRMIGTSGKPDYAFGFWFPRLRGFLGTGSASIIQFAPNSLTDEQLNVMKTMPEGSSGNPLQTGFGRVDGTQASPYRIAGMTFQAADQQLLTSVSTSSSSAVFVPTPAPHTGLLLYTGSPNGSILAGSLNHSKFIGAGRGLNSQPPFECANLHTGRGYHKWHHLEFDGRRADTIDPARPRRCGLFLINSEYDHVIENWWGHHTAISRYAANDQNSTAISGEYVSRWGKLEQITNTQNRDPALNNGNSLGGYTNASLYGWETTNAEVRVEYNILSQDNPYTNGQVPCHFQFTHVGTGAQKQGGRGYFIDNTYLCPVYPQLNGYATFRISESTYWWIDGFSTTLTVINNGVRKVPLIVPKTVSWPPTQAWLNSQGATPETTYLVRPT